MSARPNEFRGIEGHSAIVRSRDQHERGIEMLWTIFVLLLILWLLGLVTSYTLGGFIHILLVVALVVLVFQMLSGRRTAV